jgi:hypothetical protein
MPNSSRQKGDRAEREAVAILRSFGLDAYRVPLSGAASGFKSDVEIRLGNRRLRLESKVRAKEFGLIYRWLFGVDMLVLKSDCKPMLAVLSLQNLADLLGQYYSQTEKPVSKPSQ